MHHLRQNVMIGPEPLEFEFQQLWIGPESYSRLETEGG